MLKMLLSRIKGSLVTAVIGDCIGAKFEGGSVTMEELMIFVEQMEMQALQQREDGEGEFKPPKLLELLPFTDDTAMARCIAASLTEKKCFEQIDVAQRFAKEYSDDPTRGYGSNVITVLKALSRPGLKDICQPAKEQFKGRGSYGNGGAMRIAPLGLFCYKKEFDLLKTMATEVTMVTHTHPEAIVGSVLQCQAVQLSLSLDNTHQLDTENFLDTLVRSIRPFEAEIYQQFSSKQNDGVDLEKKASEDKGEEDNYEDKFKFCRKLECIRDFLNRDVDFEEVEEKLGTNISALGSVPTAIYCFLRGSQSSIKGLQNRNSLEQTILYAVSLGGDTDTIATMAGAMAGAFYGLDKVPQSWQTFCEGVEDAKQFGDKLFELVDK